MSKLKIDLPENYNFKKNKVEWNSNKRRYVAYVTGFAEKKDNQIPTSLENFSKISALNDIFRAPLVIHNALYEKFGLESIDSELIHIVSIANNFTIFSKDDSNKSFITMCLYLKQVFQSSLSTLKDYHSYIPLKGAMACGETFIDIEKNIFFGIPIIDSYQLQSNLQSYSLILHHTIDELHFEKVTNFPKLIKPIQIPFLLSDKIIEIIHSNLNFSSGNETIIFQTLNSIIKSSKNEQQVLMAKNTIYVIKKMREI